MSDGVFAIAMTLLVLNRRLPDVWFATERSMFADGSAPPGFGISRSMLLILATAASSCLLALANARRGAALWFTFPWTGGIVGRADRRKS